MNIKIALTATVIIALSCSSMLTYAQCGGGSGKMNMKKNNATSSSYGGIVRKVGKYNVEMVFTPIMMKDPISFYVTDKKGKPVSNQAISGKADFTYSDGSTETVALDARGDNGFAGQMKNKNLPFISLLTLNIRGENATLRFDGGSAKQENSSAKSVYTCPMHPEVKSDKPGNCPKCGMALEKVNS